ncbi:MAG: UDP-N-acetylmuramate dehydrogenase [Candidatus Hydrogenedentes bacterium]|jgi:UDP-N-acetylmuramate dehydrogenase|nr:UDP-N-acetylmuramate dehydrogenase [Candidatus Hydrogenedentota bacterium]
MNAVPFDFAKENYPLAPLTVYCVGGPAKLALIPRNRTEAIDAYAWMLDQDLPKLVLGGGSNVLIADEGFPGIALFTSNLTGLEDLGGDRYFAEGGVVLNTLVQDVILKHNYSGAGGLTGIPGSVGGAIYMNAGTVNGSICQLMESVEVLGSGGVSTVPMDESLYSYRGQTFCQPGVLILSGRFRFRRDEEDQRAIYDHYIQRRKEKQPEGNSCGSVFKNPEGEHAGRLIEACGLKGARRGGAVVSDLHANFILNEGSATASDILGLINLVKSTVRERCGVELREEVKIIRV